MSRRVYKRIEHLKIDVKYNDIVITKLINIVMLSGKKMHARKLVYKFLSLIKVKFLINPLHFIYTAIDNARPILLIKRRKIGGAVYNIPYRITKIKGICIVLHWLKQIISTKNKLCIFKKLFYEFVNTYNNNSNLIEKKILLYKNAINNRVFSNFLI